MQVADEALSLAQEQAERAERAAVASERARERNHFAAAAARIMRGKTT